MLFWGFVFVVFMRGGISFDHDDKFPSGFVFGKVLPYLLKGAPYALLVDF